MVHVVYCDNTGKSGTRILDKILSGTKTMIVRGAGARKIPHSRVHDGETLYFMEKGSLKISAMAKVKTVHNYVKLSDDEINAVFNDYADKMNLSEKQRERWHKTCLCLIEFSDVKPINPPLEFEKQTNMDDWLIIEKVEDVLVGTSIPYNYENARLK